MSVTTVAALLHQWIRISQTHNETCFRCWIEWRYWRRTIYNVSSQMFHTSLTLYRSTCLITPMNNNITSWKYVPYTYFQRGSWWVGRIHLMPVWHSSDQILIDSVRDHTMSSHSSLTHGYCIIHLIVGHTPSVASAHSRRYHCEPLAGSSEANGAVWGPR